MPPGSAATAPCPQCLEATELAAGTCPLCAADLHVEVLAPPVADDRTRYQVARTLAALGPPLPSFAVIQGALKPPGGVLTRHVSRADAASILGQLAVHTLEGRTRPSRGAPAPIAAGADAAPSARPSWSFGHWALAGTAALGVLVGLGLVALLVGERLLRPAPLPYAEIAERGRRATIVLTSGVCQGSGFFVTPELLLTNAHVLCADEVEAHLGTDRRPATVVTVDEEIDLALVRVDGAGGTPLRLANAMDLGRGDLVVAAGAPLGHEGTVSKGSVTRPFVSVWGVVHIEANAIISPGNSGGPLLNERAEAVGVISKLRTEGDARWALAVPANYVGDWLPEGRRAKGRGWDWRVAEAARIVEDDLRRFEAASERPLLLGAHYAKLVVDSRTSQYGMGRLVFVVAAPAGNSPGQLTVRLTCGDTRPRDAALSNWQRVDARPERTPAFDVTQLRPFLAWARKRADRRDAVVVGSGETWINYPGQCRSGKLVLLDGGAVKDTVEIE